MANAEKDTPDNQKIPVEYQQGHESFLSNWLVQGVIMVVLFAGVWIFIMRRMSGGSGGGPGGQIFNIGKSKATLFDKEAQVTVTFNDVAGLEAGIGRAPAIMDPPGVPVGCLELRHRRTLDRGGLGILGVRQYERGKRLAGAGVVERLQQPLQRRQHAAHVLLTYRQGDRNPR